MSHFKRSFSPSHDYSSKSLEQQQKGYLSLQKEISKKVLQILSIVRSLSIAKHHKTVALYWTKLSVNATSQNLTKWPSIRIYFWISSWLGQQLFNMYSKVLINFWCQSPLHNVYKPEPEMTNYQFWGIFFFFFLKSFVISWGLFSILFVIPIPLGEIYFKLKASFFLADFLVKSILSMCKYINKIKEKNICIQF